MKGANSMIKSTTERGITKVAFDGNGTILDYNFKAIVASMVEKGIDASLTLDEILDADNTNYIIIEHDE